MQSIRSIDFGWHYLFRHHSNSIPHFAGTRVVNGEGQEQPPKGRKPDPFTKTRAGELIEFSENPPRIAVAHPVYRRDAKAQRTLSIEGNKLVDVVTIETISSKPQKLGLSLHVQGKVRLPKSLVPDDRFSDGRPKAFGYWTGVSTATFHDQAAFDVDYGGLVLRLTIAVPGDFHLWHGSTPDAPPNRREGFYVEAVGNSKTFTTAFEAN